MNKILRFAYATTCSAVLLAGAAQAKMSSHDEQSYRELTSAAKSLHKSKNYKAAGEKYAEALHLAEGTEDLNKQVRMHLRLGENYYEQGDFALAEASFREALKIAQARPDADESQICECLYQLSTILIKEQKDSDAKPIFEKCMELSQKIYSSNNPILAVHKTEYGALLGRLGDKESAARLNSEGAQVINAFMADMSKKIKAAWHQPPESFSYRISVSYDVLNHGRVKDIEVTRSSGSAIADKAAVDAVKSAAPFTDIDCKNPDEQFSMDFAFDYNFHQNPSNPAGINAFSSRQSKQVKEETTAKLKEEKQKSDALKEKIAASLKGNPTSEADLMALSDMYGELAESLAVQGRYEEGVKTLSEALEKSCFKKKGDPARSALMIHLAHTHLYADDARKAEPLLNEAIHTQEFARLAAKAKHSAYEDYGNCLTKNHKFAEAQDYYTKAREIKQ
ncbi:MAG: TonB family protein [Cyanobacteria bacterium SZAS LIN-2]|nr:TonB family protein [Cyanobacteria bacterium SZAS LIN-2]MBS2009529.1 TonB family protein [Cyanobacteria bacterium SZAS TMP-1]